jgi:hypothetical protein
MQVTKADVICGLPASTARNMMRAYADDRTAEVTCEILGIDLDAAQDQLLGRLTVTGTSARSWNTPRRAAAASAPSSSSSSGPPANSR